MPTKTLFSELKTSLIGDILHESEYSIIKRAGTIKDKNKKKIERFVNWLKRYRVKIHYDAKTFTKENGEGYITKNDFLKKFHDWSKENRHRIMSSTSIGLAMKKLDIESGKKNFEWMNEGRGGQARTWLGISWN